MRVVASPGRVDLLTNECSISLPGFWLAPSQATNVQKLLRNACLIPSDDPGGDEQMPQITQHPSVGVELKPTNHPTYDLSLFCPGLTAAFFFDSEGTWWRALSRACTAVGPESSSVCFSALCTRLKYVSKYVARITGWDEDNANYYPRLKYHFEIAGNGIGFVKIDSFIASSQYSSVLSLEGRDDIVIKYQGDCDHYDKTPHPLLPDYWNGQIGAGAGVSPAIYFLSPPVSMADFCSDVDDDSVCSAPREADPMAKLRFNLFQPYKDYMEQALECKTKGKVRYMIMERVGACLASETKNGGIDPITAIDYGIQTIALHRADVIHGDIHPGNVCHRRGPLGGLTLIDYGYASSVSKESNSRPRGLLKWVHSSLTPWQLQGYSFSRRDDIYKSFFFVASMIWGDHIFSRMVHTFDDDPAGLLKWKQDGPLFEWHDSHPFSTLLDPAQIGHILTALNAVHEKVMELGVNEEGKPAIMPYMEIIEQLNSVKRLFPGEITAV